MAPLEPQSANDYDDRTTAAVKSVLVEIGQTLGSYRGKFVLIGGAVPWILLEEPDFPHIGTLDVDLSLDAEALGNGEYAGLVESLMKQGYEQRDNIRGFQLARTIDPKDDGPPIDVIVDFLMPKDADIAKNKPPLISNFAVQRADGAALAINFHEMVAITGDMPEWRDQYGQHCGCDDSSPTGDEGFCDRQAAQEQGRLRYILQYPEL